MVGIVVFIGFVIGGIIVGGIAQTVTNVKSVSDELSILAWSFAGGIVGVILADMILQSL